MVIERRKERRIKVNLPIKIVYPALSATERSCRVGKGGIYRNGFAVVGRTENLSRIGTYVEIDRNIPVGTDIDMTLESPKGVISGKGNIFRCNLVREVGSRKYYGIGIFFTDFLKETDRDKLSEYIDSLIADEDRNIKKGLKRWRKKREISKVSNQSHPISQEGFQVEVLNLLKKILSRLEEIGRLLKSQRPT